MFRCRVLAFESSGDFKTGQQLEGVVAAVMAVELVGGDGKRRPCHDGLVVLIADDELRGPSR